MTIKLPNVIGHRGAAAYAPENSLEAIHTAADIGCQWVELDVKLTKDGVPVVFHDDDLERTTNGSGKMAETMFEDLRQLEAGSWFSDSFTGITVPTLEEAIDVLHERDLGLNLELKPCPGRERETAEAVLDQMSQIWDDRHQLLISSFDIGSLEVAKDMIPDWHRGLLLGGDEVPDNWSELADYLDVRTLNIGSRMANEILVNTAIRAGYLPLIYTVNDPDEAKLFQSWGVRTLFSDEPDIIAENMLALH